MAQVNFPVFPVEFFEERALGQPGYNPTADSLRPVIEVWWSQAQAAANNLKVVQQSAVNALKELDSSTLESAQLYRKHKSQVAVLREKFDSTLAEKIKILKADHSKEFGEPLAVYSKEVDAYRATALAEIQSTNTAEIDVDKLIAQAKTAIDGLNGMLKPVSLMTGYEFELPTATQLSRGPSVNSKHASKLADGSDWRPKFDTIKVNGVDVPPTVSKLTGKVSGPTLAGAMAIAKVGSDVIKAALNQSIGNTASWANVSNNGQGHTFEIPSPKNGTQITIQVWPRTKENETEENETDEAEENESE